MRITYSETAYIQTPEALLDHLGKIISGWAEGDGNVCINSDDLDEKINEIEEDNEDNSQLTVDTLAFLKEAKTGLKENIGDIVFHN